MTKLKRPARRDVLNVVGRPKLLGRRMVAPIEKCVECFKDNCLVLRFNRSAHLLFRRSISSSGFFDSGAHSCYVQAEDHSQMSEMMAHVFVADSEFSGFSVEEGKSPKGFRQLDQASCLGTLN